MNLLLWIPALCAGLAVVIFLLAGRNWVLARFERDMEWMRATHLRFRPEPVNARLHVIAYYISYIVFLMLLWAAIPSIPAILVIWVGSWWLPRLVISWLWRRR